jgi:hypothetical protein
MRSASCGDLRIYYKPASFPDEDHSGCGIPPLNTKDDGTGSPSMRERSLDAPRLSWADSLAETRDVKAAATPPKRALRRHGASANMNVQAAFPMRSQHLRHSAR